MRLSKGMGTKRIIKFISIIDFFVNPKNSWKLSSKPLMSVTFMSFFFGPFRR